MAVVLVSSLTTPSTFLSCISQKVYHRLPALGLARNLVMQGVIDHRALNVHLATFAHFFQLSTVWLSH